MILIPYFWNTTNPDWIQFGVFLCEGGRSLWSVEDKATLAATKKMLKENGFPLLKLTKTDGVLYAQIDYTAMNMNDFYLWSEVPLGSEQDVWRVLPIPKALWSCNVFKQHFYKESNLPDCVFKAITAV